MTDGLVVVDKPSGWTSHDVVAKLRGRFKQKRVGHAGTLDPSATGVLVVGLGRVTRLLRFLSELSKTYEGEIVLGTETDTLDADGAITATHDMSSVTLDDMRRAASSFVGEIDQVPPMVSAVKIGGRRLHERARAGEEVERQPRRVTVRRFDIAPAADTGVYRITVECSSGTYVRSLAADVGHALGGGAHLRALRRTSVGPFTLADARPLDAVSLDDVLPANDALRGWPAVTVDAQRALAVAQGKVLPESTLGVSGAGPWAVVNGSGRLLAVYERCGDTEVKPTVVVVTPDEVREADQ